MGGKRTPWAARCQPCGHVWALVWMPIPGNKLGKIARSIMCPWCYNGPKNIFMASEVEALALKPLFAETKDVGPRDKPEDDGGVAARLPTADCPLPPKQVPHG